FFDTLGASILRGRDFGAGDLAGSERVAIVSRAMAEKYFPAGAAIDRMLGRGDEAVRIVGIASDIALRDLGDPAPMVIYRPAAQFYMGAMSAVVRTAPGREGEALEALRATVASIDATLPLYATRTLEGQIGQALAQARVLTGLIATFGATALLLSVAGAYGVFAYAVRTRRREFGLRLALGATPRAILVLVLGQGARVLVAGLLLGLAASLAAVRVLGALPGVSSYDPLGFAAAASLVAAVVLLALALPARQATRVDPQETLRCE
ncbi:MAG TPA: FtsX-like permease family protein, partial [Xanthomonadales bacterium]|nr:FtsX-like permease family protein [Xanthomonadales bacterium]